MIDARMSSTAASATLRQQIGQGFELLRQDRMEDAARLSESLLAAHTRDPQVLLFASEVRLAGGDAETALGLIDAAIGVMRGEVALLLKKARILLQLRRRAEARQVAAEAAALAGDDGRALWSIGKIYGGCNDPARARELYEQALAVGCGSPDLLYDLATAQFFTGDFAGAEKSLGALPTDSPAIGHALYLRSTLRRQTDVRNHVDDLQARLTAGFPDATRRAACLYALAKELEDLGHADRSFTVLTEAAALKRRTLRYDAAAERTAIDGIRATYTAEAMRAEIPGHGEEGAIFIVGMPRTGTTLVERLLGRHGEVASAGELPDYGQALAAAAHERLSAHPGKTMVEASLLLDFAALGRDYMRSAREAAPGSRMFIDKMPINFMYCGLIRRALPKARIIHLVRDPMDSCYAVYKTLFNQAYHFSYDLAELGAYYITYHRLMRHWHAVMPDAILDVRYEDLVTDTEGQARRLLAWCGLDWRPEVLSPAKSDAPSTTASAAQVREPVYTSSVGKWRRYEAGLRPLADQLMRAGISTGRT
ncbi:tetratricopeptide repeat-containing sulfotransferase family protein [Luteimonas salinilitoris]|uniref:Sulfotransferase n=1 Tax=Luteimonas salinilitoris TaxID=3237697 RepID=A0ABV4HU26_9GAMM